MPDHSGRRGSIIEGADSRARFEAEVLSHLDAAYRFARWLCRTAADAEDVVHDAVIRAYRGYDGARVSDPKSWLLAIVRNCHLDSIRRLRRESALENAADESPGEFLSQTPTPEEEQVQADATRTFQSLLGALPVAHREILVLRELEELSYGEIARVTGIPMGTVMSRLARARSALKDLWERRELGASHGLS